MNIKAVRTAVGCPWQNGVAERWVGSCRRELLDHVIALNESHLKRLLAAYVEYYHQDRTHCGLQKQTPLATALLRARHGRCVASCRRSPSSLRAGCLIWLRSRAVGPGGSPLRTLSPTAGAKQCDPRCHISHSLTTVSITAGFLTNRGLETARFKFWLITSIAQIPIPGKGYATCVASLRTVQLEFPDEGHVCSGLLGVLAFTKLGALRWFLEPAIRATTSHADNPSDRLIIPRRSYLSYPNFL